MGHKGESFKTIAVGVSAGGFNALSKILPEFPKDFALPIIVAHHCSNEIDNYLVDSLQRICAMHVKEVTNGEEIKGGVIYIAPPGHHMMISEEGYLSLEARGNDKPAPEIDILFKTAAQAYKESLIAIVLTGANSDGSEGVEVIKRSGGFVIVEDPMTAQFDLMPSSAVSTKCIDFILPLDDISVFVRNLLGGEDE